MPPSVHSSGHRNKLMSLTISAVLIIVLISACATFSGPLSYVPKAEKGSVIIMLSGKSGTPSYQKFAAELGELGYYVVLFDSNDFPFANPDACIKKLSLEIDRVLQSPHSVSRKATVIGYSLGGGLALTYASQMPERVSNIIAYYPRTSHIQDFRTFVNRFRMPIFVFQGAEDNYLNCCTEKRIRLIEQAAQAKAKPFELIVYPHVGHGFNLPQTGFNRTYADDSWHKTLEILKKYNP